jgi:hypothetical protein
MAKLLREGFPNAPRAKGQGRTAVPASVHLTQDPFGLEPAELQRLFNLGE